MEDREKEMALEIVERVILREAEVSALKRILNRYANAHQPPPETWETQLFGLVSEIQVEKISQRADQLKSLFGGTKSDDSLIRALHSEVLHRAAVS